MTTTRRTRDFDDDDDARVSVSCEIRRSRHPTSPSSTRPFSPTFTPEKIKKTQKKQKIKKTFLDFYLIIANKDIRQPQQRTSRETPFP